jgi:hypothetical protein
METKCIGSVFRRFKRHMHMALASMIVNLVGLRVLHGADEIGKRVGFCSAVAGLQHLRAGFLYMIPRLVGLG